MLDIHALIDCPHYLEQVASWHQQEWSCGARIGSAQLSSVKTETTLTERRQRLRQHLGGSFNESANYASVPASFVGFYEDEAVATVSLVHYQRLGQAPDSVWLANLFVVPEYRQQGFGGVMQQHVLDYARTLGHSKVYLYTTDREGFYQQLGWQVVRRAEFRGEPAVIMAFVF